MKFLSRFFFVLPKAEILFGGLTTLLYIGLVCLLSSGSEITDRTFIKWDSGHYERIAHVGYASTVPGLKIGPQESTTAFFPGFPLLARFISQMLHLQIGQGLVLLAFTGCWAVWVLFFVLCRRWNVALGMRLCAFCTLFIYPSAFFLTVAYSESMYLTSLVGLFFALTVSRPNPVSFSIAALCGFTASATRINGFPVAFVPLFYFILVWFDTNRFSDRPFFKVGMPYFVVSLISLAGGLLFFAYCEHQYGTWKSYLLTQKLGWGLVPDYFAFFRYSTYFYDLPWHWGPDQVSRLSVPLLIVFFISVVVCDVFLSLKRKFTQWPTRGVLYSIALINLFIPVAGLVRVEMRSMIRYGYIPYFLLVLALLHLFSRPSVKGSVLSPLFSSLFLSIGVSASPLFFEFFISFLAGSWVA